MIPEFSTRADVERLSQAATMVKRVGPDTVRCRVLAGPTLVVHDHDKSIAGWLALSGYWEAWLTLPVSKYLKPGMVAMDIGASYGYFTALMAERVGPTGLVLSVEAHPEVYALVRRSVEENGWDNVDVQCYAVGAERGEAILWQEPGNFGGASVKWDEEPGRRSFKVPQYSLDEASEGNERLSKNVDFVKIDVEGAEFDAVRGMTGIIGRSPSVAILVEVAADRGYDAREFWGYCESLGLKIRMVRYDGLIHEATFEEAFPSGAPKGSYASLWMTR